MKHGLFWLHAITPLHNGAGQGLGVIDRPIIREAATDYPFVQSSTIKGAVRARALECLMKEQKDENDQTTMRERTREEIETLTGENGDDRFLAAFGVGETEGNQGCLVFSDAQLLLLPVRSLAGTFAWATSPLALARLLRFLQISGEISVDVNGNGGTVTLKGTEVIGSMLEGSTVGPGSAVGFEPLRLPGSGVYCIEGLILGRNGLDAAEVKLSKLGSWLAELLFKNDDAWTKRFRSHLLLMNDDDFTGLARRAMQVEANIRINEKGVTHRGSLRYTEYLPAESVLVSLTTFARPLRKKRDRNEEFALTRRNGNVCHTDIAENEIQSLLDNALGCPAAQLGGAVPSIQIGADESKGRGVARCLFHSCNGASS